MDNLIVMILIAGILTGAITYILRQKNRGAACIGCPDAPHCSGHCAGCSACTEK